MTREDKRIQAYNVLSNAVKELESIEDYKTDRIVHNMHQMLLMQKTRLRSIAPNVEPVIKQVVKELPRVKSQPKKQLAPNGAVIADSSENPIVEEVKLKERLKKEDYKAIEKLFKDGLDVHQISERLAIEVNAVQRGIDKIK